MTEGEEAARMVIWLAAAVVAVAVAVAVVAAVDWFVPWVQAR